VRFRQWRDGSLTAKLMPHDTPLLATIVVGLSSAFVLGAIDRIQTGGRRRHGSLGAPCEARLDPVDARKHEGVHEDGQDRHSEDQIPSLLWEQLEVHTQSGEDERELADLGQTGRDGQRRRDRMAERDDDQEGRDRLPQHDDEDRGDDGERIAQQGHRIDDARPSPTALKDHSVLVGYGRVGSVVGTALMARGDRFVVIEDNDSIVVRLRENGIEAFIGNGVKADILAAANVAGARQLFVAVPNPFEAGQIVERARALNPDLKIVARAHSESDVEHLTRVGADAVIMGEREIARGMIEHSFQQST